MERRPQVIVFEFFFVNFLVNFFILNKRHGRGIVTFENGSSLECLYWNKGIVELNKNMVIYEDEQEKYVGFWGEKEGKSSFGICSIPSGPKKGRYYGMHTAGSVNGKGTFFSFSDPKFQFIGTFENSKFTSSNTIKFSGFGIVTVPSKKKKIPFFFFPNLKLILFCFVSRYWIFVGDFQ